MKAFIVMIAGLASVLIFGGGIGWAQSVAKEEPFPLGPPKGDRPVVVQAGFDLIAINMIDDEKEAFEFSGILKLRWHDDRQAFDPKVVGVNEKIFQGDYQTKQISPLWFPQIILVNESGLYENNGIMLRIRSDGTLTLLQSLDAVAKGNFNMRRFPFDRQRLEAVFQVLGFDESEVVLQADSGKSHSAEYDLRIPQWSLTGVDQTTRRHVPTYNGAGHFISSFVLGMEVKRESFFISRLVIFPLILIVLLSFSVFWMDRSTLGDRINVSFVGILTAVAYILVINTILPKISYVTLLNSIVNLSFLTMAGTVVINLAVGTLDKKGKPGLGDRIDFHCRWIFPLAYFGILLLAFGVFFFIL